MKPLKTGAYHNREKLNLGRSDLSDISNNIFGSPARRVSLISGSAVVNVKDILFLHGGCSNRDRLQQWNVRERERERERGQNSLFMRVIDKHVCFFTSSPRPNKRLL